jgi:pyruvate dehydrogenase E2 component (dihydrolipoamide acetyltransferase)
MKFLASAVVAALSIHTCTAFTNVGPKTSIAFTQNHGKLLISTDCGRQLKQQLTTLNAEATRITMPALSSTMKEGRVVSWLKSEGDAVSAGEAIMVVESDKADMDVEAFEDGFIAKILVREGETAPVGDVVALLAAEESEIELVAAMAGGNSVNGEIAGVVQPAASAASSPAGESPSFVQPYTEIFMPALSSTMVEGKVVSWLKSVGDKVSAGEAIMVVESDKADMDVEVFEDGYLAAILVDAGKIADVGAPVGIIVSNEADCNNFFSGSLSFSQTPPLGQNTAAAAPAVSASAAPSCAFSQVDMPALSSTMKEGKVVSWLKAEGDKISAGEAIMVVESDKADMDVEAFEEGFLAAIITGEGEVGAVGAPVALIAQSEADIPTLQAYAASLKGMPVSHSAAAPAPAPAKAAPQAAQPVAPKQASAASNSGRVVASPLAKTRAQELGIDLNTVVGTGPEGRITLADVEKAASAPATSAKKASAAPPAAEKKPAWTPAAGVIAATPTARALAKAAKLDINSIKGTGEFGRVTADDVKVATGEKKPERKVDAKSSGAPAVQLPDGLVKFTGMQRAVSKNMEATLSTPVFRVSREIQMDKFDDLYQQLKPKGVTVSALLAKAVGLALAKFPIINSSYSPEGTVFNKDINVAMAVAIDGGLITPVLKYANERTIVELGENWKASSVT